MYDTKIRKEDS